jgi:glutamate---cysteine ligase / carboxylate-amine ligase
MTSTYVQAPARTALAAPAALTLGVEEEFLLVDPHTGINVPVAREVTDALPDAVGGNSRSELRVSMLEMATGVCNGLPGLRAELVGLRRAAAQAAVSAGARLLAVGATPVGEPDRSVPPGRRYQAMVDRFGPVAQDPAVCGLHVHVGIADRELAVQVCNHLQNWLPVIRALTGNSPFYQGADTGHASWRSVQLQRWPGLGPTPYFDTVDDYDRTVDQMIASGVTLDPGMIYWYARLSHSYPTVEIRVGDVCPTVDDTVLVTALIRAMVDTVVGDIHDGIRAPRLRDCVVSAAHWCAARDGLTADLLDLRADRPRPAWELVDDLFATVTPALLRTGDIDLVADGLARLRRHGTGATRQRRAYRRTGSLTAVLTQLSEDTEAA